MTAASGNLAIVLTGGIHHPFDQSAKSLATVLGQAGFDARVSVDLDNVLATLQANPQALLVVYALRWTMTQHEKYAPYREQWALNLSNDARETIARHVYNGAGLLGVHTASICFDDWPQWLHVLGGAWRWGKSWHPVPGPAHVQLDPRHELTSGLGDFDITDEVYSDQERLPAVEVAAWAQAAEGHGPRPTGSQPVLWTHAYGRGRVVYDALGHDSGSIEHPVHSRILQRAALWASGRSLKEERSCAM